MIESVQNHENHLPWHGAGRAVLRYREEDTERTAGAMPVWERRGGAAEEIAAALDSTVAKEDHPVPADSFASALSYAEREEKMAADGEEFGFGDLVDMVNPLQHIPLVGHLYRNITGDDIRPIARIIGGGVFGGPIGGVAALANVAVEYETGKDVAGNMLAMVTGGEEGGYRSVPDQPEQKLAAAARSIGDDDPAVQNLPGNVLSFADLGGGRGRVTERFVGEDIERTAGTMIRRYTKEPLPAGPAVFLPAREPITTLSFMPLKKPGSTD